MRLDVFAIAREQLAVDLNCLAADFAREGFVFVESRKNPGRRPFPRNARHFGMLTMGGAAVVSATADCDMLRQIGIDVLPGYRRLGLAAA